MKPATSVRTARDPAVDLLRELVSIPSLSGEESEASHWLVSQMHALGFRCAGVDLAGNAVGEIGRRDASRLVVLLGHIDTVPGVVPVRLTPSDDGGEHLFGRGTVDAKGPLATFVLAVAGLGEQWALANDVRVVVVGAVEEESATSRGARYIRERFSGAAEPVPDFCIIGEPSRSHRVTLGYKGRILINLEASRASAHTAGPDPGLPVLLVDLWRHLLDFAQQHDVGRDKPFDQLLPSIRTVHSEGDGLKDALQAVIGLRLPLDFDPESLLDLLGLWVAEAAGGDLTREGGLGSSGGGGNGEQTDLRLRASGASNVQLTMRGYEPAWRSSRDNALVRAFQYAIREVLPGRRPGFVSKTGTSDMNVVAPVCRCPTVAYGPGDSALDHTPNEHVEIGEFLEAVEVLQKALERLVTT